MKDKFEVRFDALSGDYVVKKVEVENLKKEDNLRKNRSFLSFFNKKPTKSQNSEAKYANGFGYINELESNFLRTQNEENAPVDPQPNQNQGQERSENPEPISMVDVRRLLQELYNNVRKLNYIYQQLLGVGDRYANYFNGFIAENRSVQGALININDLFEEEGFSGNVSMPIIGETLDDGVREALGLVTDSLEVANQLQRLVDVSEVNRALNLISSTLNLQRIRLSSMREMLNNSEN